MIKSNQPIKNLIKSLNLVFYVNSSNIYLSQPWICIAFNI